MKKLLLGLLFLISLSLLQAQDKEPYQVKQLGNEKFSHAEVNTSGGSISVTGIKAAEARIEVFISSNMSNEHLSKEEIRQRLEEKYELVIKVENDKLVAFARAKEKNNDWKKSLNIAFRLFIPDQVSTSLHTSGGSISLEWMNGKHEFATSGGSLNIVHVDGTITGKTSGGSINLQNSSKDIDLSTSGGSIHASDCVGKIMLQTSGGSVSLENLDGLIRANTSGGSITGTSIKGDLVGHTSGGNVNLSDLSCSLETSTSGGQITVSISTLVNKVKINNSAGSINLSLPRNSKADLNLSGRMNNPSFEAFEGTIKDDTVRGKLNGGGVPVNVDAGDGKLTLSFK
jgi:DUF4097 and DUF4098 domain-containing protein YvlB